MERERIEISWQDKIWSYLAQFLSMGIGVITLPFLLNKLTSDELGVNYILLTIASIVALVDLGFAPQFARNFSFVFSGVQSLKKEGVGIAETTINFKLLSTLLKAAKYLYLGLAILSFILLVILGTPYLYITTNKFSAVPNMILIWCIYSIGIVLQVYYAYYSSMLIGRGQIKEQKIALIANKIVYFVIVIGLLYNGLSLLSVAIAQLISPFIGRYISHRCFFTVELKNRIAPYSQISGKEVLDTVKLLWYNAKRTAVMSIGAFAVIRMGMFIAGLYFSLVEFASYGLLVQLVGLLGTVSTTIVMISQPKYASMRASGEKQSLIYLFAGSMQIFYWLFIVGSIVLVAFGNDLLTIIKSNAFLPSKSIIILYCIVIFLENNQSCFATLIASDNTVPFAPASIITGIFISIGTYIVCRYTSWGIIGLIAVQGICQLAYQNWKWPLVALQGFKMSFIQFLTVGIKVLLKRF